MAGDPGDNNFYIYWECNEHCWEASSFDLENDYDTAYNTNLYSWLLAIVNNEHHINPKDWYSLVWFNYSFSYADEWNGEDLDPRNTNWSWKVYSTDTTTFWDIINKTWNPRNWTFVQYDSGSCSFDFTISWIRKDNQNNTITTSFKDNVEYKLWGGGWGEWWLVRADNSPDKPKYWRVGSEEDYQELEQKYTEQENDTIYFTY